MKTNVFSIVTAALLLFGCGQNPEPETGLEEESTYSAETKEPSITPEEQAANNKAFEVRTEILQKLKAKAERDWPDDYTTQEYWINEEIAAYDYMLTIPDDEIKRKAQRDWPIDFTTQKYWYHEQVDAKERLK